MKLEKELLLQRERELLSMLFASQCGSHAVSSSCGDMQSATDTCIKMEPDDDSNIITMSTKLKEAPLSQQGPAHPRKYKKQKDQKYCLICSDKALGYNFNAISCESCKAFFRRNALKNQNLRCLFTGNCKIDVRTRRFCPYCRLKKCYEIGMRKEMILDEEEKKIRMEKVTMNRLKKKKQIHVHEGQPSSSISTSSSLLSSSLHYQSSNDSDMPHSSCMLPSENALQDQSTDPTTSVKDDSSVKHEFICHSDASNSSCSMSAEQPRERTMSSSSSMCPIVLPNVSLNYESSFRIDRSQLPQEDIYYRKLTMEEIEIIETVSKSYREIMTSYVHEDSVNKEDTYSNLNDLVNNSEFAVRRMIKFVKMLPDFKKLPQIYQIQALKSCVLRTLLLRSVNFYDMENDAWKTPTGFIPNHVLKKATGFHELHDSHTLYCRTLKNLSDDDISIISLLQMIIIFDPDVQNVPDIQVMSDIQDSYIVLLKHYLESTVSYINGQLLLSKLLNKIDELKKLGDSHAKILLQVNANQIEPLMLEVLNLPICEITS